MKLYDIIKSNNWLSVELTFIKLYPEEGQMLDEYRSVYENLQNLAPEDTNMKIVLTEHDSDADDESDIAAYVDVSGQYETKDENECGIRHAIEFVEWKKWLGMGLESDTLKNFTELEIISHCLYEMTFIGFDENEIKERRELLDKTIEEFKNLTEEEKKQRTISPEELKRRLD